MADAAVTKAERARIVEAARRLSAQVAEIDYEPWIPRSTGTGLAVALHAQAQGLLLAVAIADGQMTPEGRWVDG